MQYYMKRYDAMRDIQEVVDEEGNLYYLYALDKNYDSEKEAEEEIQKISPKGGVMFFIKGKEHAYIGKSLIYELRPFEEMPLKAVTRLKVVEAEMYMCSFEESNLHQSLNSRVVFRDSLTKVFPATPAFYDDLDKIVAFNVYIEELNLVLHVPHLGYVREEEEFETKSKLIYSTSKLLRRTGFVLEKQFSLEYKLYLPIEMAIEVDGRKTNVVNINVE